MPKTTKNTNRENNFSKVLLKYIGTLAVLCLFAQMVVSLRDNEVDAVAMFALVPAALYYAYFNIAYRKPLSKVRFGSLVAHCAGFLLVNFSYHAHAFFLLIDSGQPNKPILELSTSWFGVLFAMPFFWGFGLLVHMLASVSRKGFENLEV
ncbi:hypothetical protein CSA80_04065 [Candidatus Saccharibacteria bacterium]|nr:MAG: hypothetical protein CR973_00020 [Candidatus Saccharibacteria bacterium]PID98852.1 MAG: hypothetical protein CSA80_04065 [Candidatus Saccharibacteria bacterium]